MGRRRVIAAGFVLIGVTSGVGCSALVSLDGLQGSSDAGSTDGAAIDGVAIAEGGADSQVANDGGIEIDAAPVKLLAHTAIVHQGSTVTTATIDTTGASLIVIAECTFSTGPAAPTDSAGNAWQSTASSYGISGASGQIKLFYVSGPKTSAAHTFTDPGNDFLAIAVVAFSDTLATSTVLDEVNGGQTAAGPLFSAGNVTPTQTGELFVAFACSGDSHETSLTIANGFSLVDTAHDGNAEDLGSAFWLSPPATAAGYAAANPAWDFAGDTHIAGVLASFKHP